MTPEMEKALYSRPKGWVGGPEGCSVICVVTMRLRERNDKLSCPCVSLHKFCDCHPYFLSLITQLVYSMPRRGEKIACSFLWFIFLGT